MPKKCAPFCRRAFPGSRTYDQRMSHSEQAQRPLNVADLKGVWRRAWIRWPDGREDASTDVYWVQGSRCYADVRLPAARPDFGGVRSFASLSKSQLEWLVSQQGFAGELRQEAGAWRWHREVNYQPPTASRDIGRLSYVDGSANLMLEDGVDEPYRELWERIDSGESTGGHALVLRPPAGLNARGLLVAIGDYFLMALDRRPPLPMDGSLERELGQTEASPQRVLGMEISLGRRAGPIDSWGIGRSTLPWVEGQTLFARDGRNGLPAEWEVVEGSEAFPGWRR